MLFKEENEAHRGGGCSRGCLFKLNIMLCGRFFSFKEGNALHPITVLQWAACDFSLAGEWCV